MQFKFFVCYNKCIKNTTSGIQHYYQKHGHNRQNYNLEETITGQEGTTN